jgi:hypothetical protein
MCHGQMIISIVPSKLLKTNERQAVAHAINFDRCAKQNLSNRHGEVHEDLNRHRAAYIC